jgi:imidazolonepropionase-like amidohydrolase
MTGMTVYPGFTDSYSDLGMPKKASRSFGGEGPGQQKPDQPKGARYWNDAVQTAEKAELLFSPDPKAAEKLRSMGFTTALVVPQKGLLHGSSSLMLVGDGPANYQVLKREVAQHGTFETGISDGYPGSTMGAIALIRQTILDAQWQRDAMQAWERYPMEPKPEYVPELAALKGLIGGTEPLVMETSDEHAVLRAEAIASEFSLKLIVRGSGYEYRRLDAIRKTRLPIIVPLSFPETPSVQSADEAVGISLRELRHWDEAPENPGRLDAAGVEILFGTSLLKDPGSFLTNLRVAVGRGLKPDAALAALTVTPAKLFGTEKNTGTIEPGKIANLVVADGDIFSKKTKVMETWVAGTRYVVKARPEFDPRGSWTALLSGAPIESLSIAIKGDVESLQGTLAANGKEAKPSSLSFSDLKLSLHFEFDSAGFAGVVRMSGTLIGDALTGTGELADGKAFTWSAKRTKEFTPEPDTSKSKPPGMASFPAEFPTGSFGRQQQPPQPDELLIRNATIWTSGPKGILQNTDILVERGKIRKIGQNLAVSSKAVVVDATGKHVSPGIIDCHSHTAVAGNVNEGGQAITAEVRIGDVIDPDDISIYRQLAGGVTTANVLHGSANAIGGQNQVIKMRWGSLAGEMKFEGAQPGVKFALGENPKQSNWFNQSNPRYPQSRMGVEQIVRDEFTAAIDYEKSWRDFKNGKKHIPPRRDLQEDAMLEIVKGERLIHAHSYRQDEILMLARLAHEFGCSIAAFQHVLEGYKVADEIAKVGAGASCFSDWWAYKFEVYDAIPYAGALMHDAGVVVSFNSDSDELARRLNAEAAKAVKYGGVSEVEALKFVTLNPAKQLRIDRRVGSIEVGKDADIAIWSGSPLSTYSMCEQTWVDGRKYFDRSEDREMNRRVLNERATLIQKILSSKSDGSERGGGPPKMKKDRYSCHEHELGGR